MKKVRWVLKMYRDWRNFSNGSNNLMNIVTDLDGVQNLSKLQFVKDIYRFLTEVKKLDGSEFLGKTLYDIIICFQFHLETLGFSWKLLCDEVFKDIRFTLDNLMKQRCALGIGVSVQKAQILCEFEEELFWSEGL